MEPAPDFSAFAARADGRVSLVVSDVDGTLMTHAKTLTPAAIAAVAALHEAGIAFSAVSSRPPRGMSMLVEPLGLAYPLGAFNGGTLFTPDMTILEEHLIPAAAARQAIDIAQTFGADIWLFSGEQWLLTNPDAHYVPRERHTVLFDPTRIDDFEPWLGKAGKIVASSENPALLATCESAIRSALGDTATARCSQTYYLDITPPGIDKGTAVRSIARMMNVPLHEVAVLGDMANDLPMFAVAGLSVAMGNGSDKVRAAADFVTGTCDDDGFANAVSTFILPRSPARIGHPR